MKTIDAEDLAAKRAALPRLSWKGWVGVVLALPFLPLLTPLAVTAMYLILLASVLAAVIGLPISLIYLSFKLYKRWQA